MKQSNKVFKYIYHPNGYIERYDFMSCDRHKGDKYVTIGYFENDRLYEDHIRTDKIDNELVFKYDNKLEDNCHCLLCWSADDDWAHIRDVFCRYIIELKENTARAFACLTNLKLYDTFPVKTHDINRNAEIASKTICQTSESN